MEVEVVRTKITLACTECKRRNYDTTKDKKAHPDRMETVSYTHLDVYKRQMRTSINSNSSAAEVNKQENMLTEAMGKIMAVAESYPELKANEKYIKTMDSVNEYEKMVRQSRLIYYDSVTKLNLSLIHI